MEEKVNEDWQLQSETLTTLCLPQDEIDLVRDNTLIYYMFPRGYEKWGSNIVKPWICGADGKLTAFNDKIQRCDGPDFPIESQYITNDLAKLAKVQAIEQKQFNKYSCVENFDPVTMKTKT